jgi:hypothetical protein
MDIVGLFDDWRNLIFGCVVSMPLKIYPTGMVSFGDGATLQHHEYKSDIYENGAIHDCNFQFIDDNEKRKIAKTERGF